MKLQKFYISFSYLILSFAIQNVFAQDYQSAYLELRKIVYNSTTATEKTVKQSYNKAISLIKNDNKIDYLIEKSKCDYLLGLFYVDNLKNADAINCFQSSMDFAQKSIDIKPTAQGYLAYAESLAQICPLKPVSYLLANGLKVGSISKKALKLDKELGAARYLVCCIIVYAPKPFRNLSKGEKEFLRILNNDNLDKEDYFNVYRSLGYIHYQQKDFTEADKWFDLASEIYPQNKFLLSLQSREYQKDDYVTVDVEPIIDNMLED